MRLSSPDCTTAAEGALDHPGLFEIIIGLDDLAQLFLGPAVAAVGVRVVNLHEFLKTRLDILALGVIAEVQRLERFTL